MSRKFNVGRQGEQLLNEEFHNLYMTLKYLVENYTGVSEDFLVPEKQTEIPKGALRTTPHVSAKTLKIYNGSSWESLCQPSCGYMPLTNEKPLDYQMCIDNGVLKYYDPTSKMWMIAQAYPTDGVISLFNGLNFQFIRPLEFINGGYPVPYAPYGRLITTSGKLGSATSDTNKIFITTNDAVDSWIHINPEKLIDATKRLILINKDPSQYDYGKIYVNHTNTEYYGFKAGNRFGTLLFESDDYELIAGGINLLDSTISNYDYVYSISYKFDEYPCAIGVLRSGVTTVGGKNEVYIGQTAENVSLFLDGLSLEQSDENNNTIYEYNRTEGTVTFTDDDDAEIINNMQMAVLTFPDKTNEYTIMTETEVDTDSYNVRISIEDASKVNSFIQPIVFVSGLGLQETDIYQDIVIENDVITIKNFIPAVNEPYKLYIADAGNSYIHEGILESNKVSFTIEEDNFDEVSGYAVFVNGILLTSMSEDFSVIKSSNEDGTYTIEFDFKNAHEVEYNELNYVAFEINEVDDSKIGVMFDDIVSYYSVRIDDKGAAATYNDCNTALVYIDGNLILDEKVFDVPLNSLKCAPNQIFRIDEEYFICDNTGTYDKFNDEEKVINLESLVGYYSTTGSIQLIGNNQEWTGKSISYYAYSYANMIDEQMLFGVNKGLTILTNRDVGCYKPYEGKVGKKHAFKAGCNSLTTYINGVHTANTETNIEEGVTRSFKLNRPVLNMKFNEGYYGTKDVYKALEYLAQNDGVTLESQLSDGSLISDYFATEQILEVAKSFVRDTLKDTMTKETVSYVVEKIERNEYFATERDYINLETGGEPHSQIYQYANDSIITDFSLRGTTSVYLNGVLLDNKDYSRFNNDKIMFNVDVCGLQELPIAEKMMDNIPDNLKDDIIEIYKDNPRVLRMFENNKMLYIPTSSRDEILVERRDDTSIKTLTLTLEQKDFNKDSNNNSLKFTKAEYPSMPESLFNTGDLVKIYINGVFYDGEYRFINDGEVKGIELLDDTAVTKDGIYSSYEIREQYEALYGPYKPIKVKFEWR